MYTLCDLALYQLPFVYFLVGQRLELGPLY